MKAHPVYAFGHHLLRTTELDVGRPLFNIHTVYESRNEKE